MAKPEQQRGQPHLTAAFFQLMGLFKRQTRPQAFDDLEDERDGLLSGKAYQEAYERLFMLAADRHRKFEVFDEMDTYGLPSAILDVYAEESTQRDYDRGKIAWVESKATHVVDAVSTCFENCQVEDRGSAIARNMCKYGDDFERLLYSTGQGVLGWRMTRAADVHRKQDKYGRLVGFSEKGKKYRGGAERNVSWPWDYIHFRLLGGKEDENGYGTSILASMFREWRRMTLTEEAILMYRLRRMPDRNMIQVNVGRMEESEAMAFVNLWRKRFRKYEFIDPASPGYKHQYNPLTPLEDVFVPLIEGRENRVDTLPGGGNIGEVFDLDHFRDAFFGSAKVPKAYFGFEGDINAKATLIQQDVRFARTAKRVQRAFIYGLRQLGDIHLSLLQRDDASRLRFDFTRPENAYMVQMAPVAYLDEYERLELVKLRAEVIEQQSRFATDMQLDPRAWATYLLLHYAKLPEEMVLKLIRKTPDEPPPPLGGVGAPPPPGVGFESNGRARAMILDEDGDGARGFYSLSESEQLAAAHMVHESPRLRKLLGDFAEYALEDGGQMQTDSSLIPPRAGTGSLSDSVANTTEARELNEDLRKLMQETLEEATR